MVRFAIASIGGFFLVFIEIYIVVIIKGYHTIEIGGLGPFINIWAMNFFLLYTIVSHIQLWLAEKETAHKKTFLN